jgi:hypothetical protein
MILVKSCKARDHINKGSFKLGTLREYRETELKEIADKEEGVLRFHIKFDGQVEVEKKWFNTLFASVYQNGDIAPTIFPGKFKAIVQKLHPISSSENSIIIRNSSALIERESPNCFVYCMSAVNNLDECKGMFRNYDDYWAIDYDSAEKFGIELAQILYNAIIDEHKKPISLIPKHLNPEQISIELRLDEVKYFERDIHFSEKNENKLSELMQILFDTAFIKPQSFHHEKEFRFRFTLLFRGEIIEPMVKAIIMSSEKLKKFVK